LSDFMPPDLGVDVALLVLERPCPGVAVAPEPVFENGSVVVGAVDGVEAVPAPPPVVVPAAVLDPVLGLVPVADPVPAPVLVPVCVDEPVCVEEPAPVVGSVLTPVVGGVEVVPPHVLQPPVPTGDSVADTAGEPVSLVTPAPTVDPHGSEPLEVQVDDPEPASQPVLWSVAPDELPPPPV
jgi:hypothetical protein